MTTPADVAHSDPNRQWHLDRRVPVAIIFAIAVQTMGIVWWASSIDARLAQVEAEQARRQTQESRLVALEVRLQAISENIAAMRKYLEQVIRRPLSRREAPFNDDP